MAVKLTCPRGFLFGEPSSRAMFGQWSAAPLKFSPFGRKSSLNGVGASYKWTLNACSCIEYAARTFGPCTLGQFVLVGIRAPSYLDQYQSLLHIFIPLIGSCTRWHLVMLISCCITLKWYQLIIWKCTQRELRLPAKCSPDVSTLLAKYQHTLSKSSSKMRTFNT